MKNVLTITSLLILAFTFSCSTDSTSGEKPASAPTSTNANTATPAANLGPAFAQNAPVVRVEFADSGEETIATYLVNGKDLTKEMVEPNGLNSLEAHLANMFAIGSGKCAQASDKISFVLINNENKLQGRYDFPCGYIRRVFSTIGKGATKEYSTIKGSNTEIIATNQLHVSAANLESFQNIVRGLEPMSHNGVEIGEVIK